MAKIKYPYINKARQDIMVKYELDIVDIAILKFLQFRFSMDNIPVFPCGEDKFYLTSYKEIAESLYASKEITIRKLKTYYFKRYFEKQILIKAQGKEFRTMLCVKFNNEIIEELFSEIKD